MKKTILFLTIFLITKPCFASYLFPAINECAYQDGGQWYGVPQICSTGFNQGDGIAYHFNLTQDYVLKSFEGRMQVQDNDPATIESAWHNIVIYSNTQVSEHSGDTPLNSLFSKSFTVKESGVADWHGINQKYSLSKGDYWFAVEGGSGYMRVDPNIRLATIHNPEPITLALFGFGLLPFLRRKYIQF